MRKFLALIVLIFTLVSYATTTITGTGLNVVDGKPITGVSFVVDDTSTGIITDTDGKFSFYVESEDQVIVSRRGVVPKTFLVYNGMVPCLSGNAQVLDEVMVVAYDTEKLLTFTKPYSIFNANKIDKIHVQNLENALIGKVAEVQINTVSEQLNSNSFIDAHKPILQSLYNKNENLLNYFVKSVLQNG